MKLDKQTLFEILEAELKENCKDKSLIRGLFLGLRLADELRRD